MIGSGRDVPDRAGSAVERQLHKCRIRQVAMQADRNAGHRFEVLGIQQDSRYFERIDHASGREREREVFKYVLLIIICNGIGEVDRIGRVGFQRVFQFDHRLLPGRADNRQFHLRRSDNHIL